MGAFGLDVKMRPKHFQGVGGASAVEPCETQGVNLEIFVEMVGNAVLLAGGNQKSDIKGDPVADDDIIANKRNQLRKDLFDLRFSPDHLFSDVVNVDALFWNRTEGID